MNPAPTTADAGADRRTERRRAWSVVALLAGSLILNLIPFWWGADAYRTWAFDELSPTEVFVDKAWPAKYPPLYRKVARAVLSPLEELELGPRLGWSRQQTLLAYLLLMRLVNVVLGTATVWLVYRIGARVGGWRAGWLAGAAIALSPSFAYYAKMANLDMPQLFFFAASVLAALRWLESRTFGSVLAMTLLAAAAIAAKTSAWTLYPLWPIAFLLAPRWCASTPKEEARRSPVRDWRPWAALLAGIAALVLLFRLPPGMTFQHHVRALTRAVRSTPAEWPNNVSGHAGLLADGVALWSYVLGLPLSLAALAGLVLLWRRRERRAVALLVVLSMASSYVFGIALIRFHAERYYLPVALLAAVTAGYALDRLLGSNRSKSLVAGCAVAISFAWAGTRAVAVGGLMLTDTRLRAERWLADRGDSGGALAIGRHQYLPRGPRIRPWRRFERDRCGRLTRAAPGVVFVSPEDPHDGRARDTLRLLRDHSGLRLERVFERPAWSDWVIPRPKVTNLDKISPTVLALVPSGEPCKVLP